MQTYKIYCNGKTFYTYICNKSKINNMSGERVVRGRIFKVDNTERKFGSALSYNFISVQDTRTEAERLVALSNGGSELLPTEYSLLFTDAEIDAARRRALLNPEDLLSKSFWSDLTDDL